MYLRGNNFQNKVNFFLKNTYLKENPFEKSYVPQRKKVKNIENTTFEKDFCT